MKRKLFIIAFFIGTISLFTIVSADYNILQNLLFKTSSIFSNSDDYCKIIFNKENSDSTDDDYVIYKKKDEILKLEDCPFIVKDSMVCDWTLNGKTILSARYNKNETSLNEFKIQNNNEIILNYLQNNNFNSLDDAYLNETTGNISKSNDGNKTIYNFNDNGTNSNTNDVTNKGSLGGIFSNTIFNLNYKSDQNNQVIENDLAIVENQANGDITIGLEDKTSSYSLYKPKSGSNSSNQNCCVNRIKLSSDLYLTGNSEMNIGAMTGFYGGDDGWSQMNFQGFITGEYSELDLCGNDLVIENGSSLFAYGSIVDSSGEGSIIVKNGGELNATFVIEDQNHETGMPVSYLYNDGLFAMYRMPYLNCDVYIEYGGILNGILRIDFGGDNDNFADDIFKIIGPSNEYIFQMTNNKGYIYRKCYYDVNLQNILDQSKVANNNKDKNKTFCEDNLLYQREKYCFYDCDIIFNLPKLTITYKYLLSSVNLTFNLNKGSFYISPYFDYYFYSSSIKIFNNLIFLPGSYVYIDEYSFVYFSSKDLSIFEGPTGLLSGSAFGYERSVYHPVAGVNFVLEVHNFAEALSTSAPVGWVDDGDNSGSPRGGGNSLIFRDATYFWTYMNKKQSNCDLNGKFIFDETINNNFNGNSYSANNLSTNDYFYIGGNINIKNVENFKSSLNNNVYLYNSSFKSGPNACFGNGIKDGALNITDYFTYPLISYGNVITDLTEPNKVRDNYSINYNFNLATGLIETGLVKYAFIFNDNNTFNNDAGHLKKSNYGVELGWFESFSEKNTINAYLDGVDGLKGNYYPVSTKNLSEGTYIQCTGVPNSGGNNYLYFHGAFVPFDSLNISINIEKFRADKSNFGGVTKFIQYSTNDAWYGHDAWRLK